MSHLASRIGLKGNEAFSRAYWSAFDAFFGPANAPMIKATLLARVAKADAGEDEIDRVCLGLRQTMGWAADAIEQTALERIGRAVQGEMLRASPKRTAN